MSMFPMPDYKVADAADLAKMSKDFALPKDMAAAAALMTNPLAATMALSAIGFGFASQALGIWAGAVAGTAQASQSLLAPLAPKGAAPQPNAAPVTVAGVSKPKPELKVVARLDPAPKPEPVRKVVAKVDSAPEAAAKPVPAAKVVAKPEPAPTPTQVKKTVAKVDPASEVTAKAVPAAKVAARPEPAPTPVKKLAAKADPAAKTTAKAIPATKVAARAEPAETAVAKAEPVGRLAEAEPAKPVVARTKPAEPAAAAVAAATPGPAAVKADAAALMPEDFHKPRALDRPATPDDLKAISGIGPKLEKVLNDLGVWTYAQIAGWGAQEIAWVDDYLSFSGRIGRDKWIEQAGKLAAASAKPAKG